MKRSASRPGRVAGVLVAALLAASTAAAAAAAENEPRHHWLVRVYDWTNGFPWSYAGGLEQDRRGFLWVATTSGLYRFDGTRAIRAAGPLFGLAPGSTAAGRVVTYAGSSERTYEATRAGLVPLDQEPTEPEARPLVVAVASDGTPWRVREGILERLHPDRSWIASTLPLPPGDPLRLVRPGRDGRVYAATGSSVWVVEADGSTRLLAPIDRALLILERADGSVVIGANQSPSPVTTRLFEVAGGATRPVYEERGSRLLSIAERGDLLWVSMDRGLQALGPGYLPRHRLGPPAIPATGHLLVDHEGSLWMATPRGLVQIPEPDIYAVLPATGAVTRTIARTTHGVWGTFWGALAFVSDEPDALRLVEAGEHYAGLCRDGAGRVWTAGGGGMRRLGADGTSGPVLASGWDPHACGEGAGERRWIVSRQRDLYTVLPDDDRPRPVPLDLEAPEGITFATEAKDGTLWLAAGPRICGAPAEDVLAGRPAAWNCEEIAGADHVIDLQPMPSGDIWALTLSPGSIRRRAGGRWEVLPGMDRLVVSFLNTIAPSPSGGVWLAGQGSVVRIAERLDLPEGYEVLERPTAWNGIITLNVAAMEEDSDGTLWLGTDRGIQKIPPEVRRRRAGPPAVELVEGSVNGVPIDSASPVDLPYRRNRLDVHFAALSYRDSAAVRYRMRLQDEDPWSTASEDGRFTFVNLAPGRYDLQVIATLDGTRWSDPAARLGFRVMRPLYAEPWFLGGATIATAGLAHLGFRMRVRRRLARERQRARIAMDLHDEVGSGLGTIAVLAGIVGRPDLPEPRRGDVAGRIAAVSQELARSLTDIVWSLRTSSGSLDALWDQLLERARPLFEAGRPRVTFEAPDPVPHEPLSLVVRRNLHLVAYEALHNAARHSGASIVALRLVRDGRGWRLEVEDDGRGLPTVGAGPSVRRGLGIEAIKARVAEMGGTIAWDRGTLGGTRVTVAFRTGDG